MADKSTFLIYKTWYTLDHRTQNTYIQLPFVLQDFAISQILYPNFQLQILSCRADGFVCWLSYASTNKCPDSLRFFCKMLLKNSSVDEKPNALAFWQWLALSKLRSNEAKCVSPAYIIAVRNWRVRSTKSERKQRTMRHY